MLHTIYVAFFLDDGLLFNVCHLDFIDKVIFYVKLDLICLVYMVFITGSLRGRPRFAFYPHQDEPLLSTQRPLSGILEIWLYLARVRSSQSSDRELYIYVSAGRIPSNLFFSKY